MTWSVTVGFTVETTVIRTTIVETAWVFCPEDAFTSRRLRYLRFNQDRARDILPRTEFRGTLELRDGRPRNTALPVRDVERVTGDEVPRYRATPTRTLGAMKIEREREPESARDQPLFRPRVTRNEVTPPEKDDAYRGALDTLREKQAAEARILEDRHERQPTRLPDGRDVKTRQAYERDKLDTRHTRELESLKSRYPQQSRTPNKDSSKKQPTRQPSKSGDRGR